MNSELTNLLPPSRQNLLAREYFFRLGVVAVSLCIVLVLAAAVLLVPTYVFLTGNAQAKEARLANIKSTLSSANEVALSARLKALSNDATALTLLSKKQTASTVMRAALAVSRPGITLSGFTYTSAGGKNTLGLTGIASARDTLRNYQLALQSAPFARSADLPVSAYAKDTNIAFTITITLAP